MQGLPLCSHFDGNHHVKLVKFCWVDKRLKPSVPSCRSNTVSYNVCILLHRRAKCVSGTRPSTWSSLPALVVVRVERSRCASP